MKGWEEGRKKKKKEERKKKGTEVEPEPILLKTIVDRVVSEWCRYFNVKEIIHNISEMMKHETVSVIDEHDK